MSDTATTPDVATAPAQEAVEAKTEADKARATGDDLATWKAEARKWEAQAKANANAAKKLQEIEDAAKTVEQKQAEMVASLEKELAELRAREQRRQWVSEIAAETGVPVDALEVLQGTTQAEIKANAEKITSLIKPQPVAPVVREAGKTPNKSGATTADMFAEALADLIKN